ncbi:hypothetical protein D910_04950 [Dendroctonus ponderosae]|uniref:Carboxypeptidase activation peptide domain-containing protein n=1 Tax=Dendroctonus ponderosae TaxID=77166 RepID=U4U117_DENPD|nr:hypothetical protein D910_04950 [Dendroctonus ponderosae]
MPIGSTDDLLSASRFSIQTYGGTIAENVPVDILVPPKEAETFSRFLDDADIESSILNKNIQNAIDAEGFRPEARAGTFDWTSYHTFDEVK